MNYKIAFGLFLFGILTGCQQPDLSPLEKSLWSAHPSMMKVLHDPSYYEIQILYTHIERDAEGNPQFTTFDFNLNDSTYFYPASTIKFPVAVLALEYLDSLGISANAPYLIKNDSIIHTVADDVRQIFAVSDNEAYNRLYELLGRDYVNSRMRELKLGPFRLAHRLSTKNADNALRDSLFFESPNDVILGGGIDSTLSPLKLKNVKKGLGYMSDGILINSPMDFSKKNYFPLRTQQELMARLYFPESYPEEQRLNLSASSIDLLRETMSKVPREQGYDQKEFYDSYVKFFLFGDSKEEMSDVFRIYNKVGYAYGTLAETAYIRDTENNIEFLLSATILVNNNGVFNDNEYEYESLGIPFMAQLGRELYLREREMLQK